MRNGVGNEAVSLFLLMFSGDFDAQSAAPGDQAAACSVTKPNGVGVSGNSEPNSWEVTGRVGDASLTFVTMVVRAGDGSARYDPPGVGR
jgi:hypothetical protein